ncbi:MAG: DNA replication/repair protein RecF [Cyclobacteriaceae bacterium]|nr:DNA replication/repair protein RecF [Cyclobacteriaceae bacterium]
MHLERLHLIDFKNYQEVDLQFSSRINVLVGKNGSGKTNLLDAIYYLSMTRSAFSASDQQVIRIGQPFFVARGHFKRDEVAQELVASLQSGSKKVFKEGGLDYQKMSDHVGKYPVVLITPDDTDLVKEGGEARRKFFDSIISQLDKTYLEDLMQYNHTLKQRNALLRMFQEAGSFDSIALEAYDQALARLGLYIFRRRSEFVIEFLPVFRKYFQFLVADEEAGLEYDSLVKSKDFLRGLNDTRHRDLALARTSFGIHKDDYLFSLGGGDLKRLGSQGQQKSFVIAMKLTQYELIERHKGFKPILLLDDIFDKLDDGRIARLLELIKRDLGQLFITDARPDRTGLLLKAINVEASVFKIEKGNAKEV